MTMNPRRAGVDWAGVVCPMEAGGVRILLDLSKKVREALYSRVRETCSI